MKLLITGVSGLTGKYILNHPLRPANVHIVGTSKRRHEHPDFEKLKGYHPLDFCQLKEYSDLIENFRPDVIANLGGDGNVDNVEKNPEASHKSNFEFPLYLLKQAERIGASIVQFSSNAVYDGVTAPYSESAVANPLNQYGSLKARVDEATRQFQGRWLILRPIVMYGWNYSFGRNNPVSQFVPMLEAGKSIRMVADQFENPVYAGDTATIFWKCVLDGVAGEFNIGGSDEKLSRYEWFRKIASDLGLNPNLVQAASMNDFTLPAQRPRDTRFDITKVVTKLAVRPVNVAEGLRLMMDEREPSKIAA